VITPALGSMTITGDANITLTGNALTSSLGDETATGTAEVDATGNSLSIATNDVTVTGNAIVSPSGIAIVSSIGDASQETSYEAPSVSATLNVGSVNIRTDVVFTITGVSATSSLGNLQGTFWNQVDDSNSGISWTEVHKAA
jgi:hypothetical protein